MKQNPYPVRVDRAFEKKWNRYSFWAALTILAGLVVTMVELFQSKRFGLPGWLGFGSFAWGMYLMHRKHASFLRNYRCPECEGMIDQPRNEQLNANRGESAVLFDCDRCMISWDTTLRTDLED